MNRTLAVLAASLVLSLPARAQVGANAPLCVDGTDPPIVSLCQLVPMSLGGMGMDTTPWADGNYLRGSMTWGVPGWDLTNGIPTSDLPACGGDLAGTLSDAIVGGIQGYPIAPNMPTAGDVLTWSADAGAWLPSHPAPPAQPPPSPQYGPYCNEPIVSLGLVTTTSAYDQFDLVTLVVPEGTPDGGGAVHFSVANYDATMGSGGSGDCMATYRVTGGMLNMQDASSRVFCSPVAYPTSPTSLVLPFGVPVFSGTTIRTWRNTAYGNVQPTIHVYAQGRDGHTIQWRANGCVNHTY
jgi:hypothetical protein